MKRRTQKKRASRSRRVSRVQYVHAMGCVVCNMAPLAHFRDADRWGQRVWGPGELRAWKYTGSHLHWARVMMAIERFGNSLVDIAEWSTSGILQLTSLRGPPRESSS